MMRRASLILLCLAFQQAASSTPKKPGKKLATMLLESVPALGFNPAGKQPSRAAVKSSTSIIGKLAERKLVTQMFFDKDFAIGGPSKRVLVAGVLSNTGQMVARTLADSSYDVTALCTPEMGRQLKDDNGPLSATKVVCVGSAATSVLADALVVATDDAPPVPALKKLLETCKDVGHTVFLSRLGGSTGRGGLSAWKAAEEAATKLCDNLTIVRLGEPILGGPYHALDLDSIRYGQAKVADGLLVAEVDKGDSLSQPGFGSSRKVVTSAIASILRRGPEQQTSYSVSSDAVKGVAPTTGKQFDELFAKAAGPDAATGSSASSSVQVPISVDDEALAPFTKPYVPPPPGILDILAANFFGNPAKAGPNWFILIFFLGGMYQCTLPDYIQRTGIDVFGLAPQYGIEFVSKDPWAAYKR